MQEKVSSLSLSVVFVPRMKQLEPIPYPSVDVVIVTWNGKDYLIKCLKSLQRQHFRNFKITVVDNGSKDGTFHLVEDLFPHVNIIRLDKNLGFSKAVNIAIRETAADLVALLNNDTEQDAQWLAELVNAQRSNPDAGSFASKMLLFDDRSLIDTCGDYFTVEGIAGKRHHLQPEILCGESREVFGTCAGAALYRRSMLEDIGMFDNDFFITHEDSDLSFRAQLMGYRCLSVPSSIVYHHLGGTIGHASEAQIYYAQRNVEFVYIKNMPTSLFLKYWPAHIFTNFLLILAYANRGQLKVFLKAKLNAARMLPLMLGKRKTIQRNRRVSDEYIDSILTKGWLMKKVKEKLASIFKQSSTQTSGETKNKPPEK